ncbi:MAG: hypothetical protein ACLSE6_00205 [Alphaproteobacteria bacterium]
MERNLLRHPEVKKKIIRICLSALYEPDAIIPGMLTNLIIILFARTSPEKNSVVLLRVANNKDNFEIVHIHWAKNKQRKSLERERRKDKKKARLGGRPTHLRGSLHRNRL